MIRSDQKTPKVRRQAPPANSDSSHARVAKSSPLRPKRAFGGELQVDAVRAAEEFFALWIPFEMEIGRLTQALVHEEGKLSEPSEQGTKEDDERQKRYIEVRRGYLEEIFAQAQAKDAGAMQVVDALDDLTRTFGVRVIKIVERGEFDADAGEEPGQVAIRQLAQDKLFLQQAQLYNSLFNAWLVQNVSRTLVSRGAQGRLSRTVELPANLRFLNDAIHAVTVQALSQPEDWIASDDFAYAFRQRHSKAKVTIGLPNGEEATSLWEYLCKHGPRMVKAHYALWARYYEDIDQQGMRYVVISIPQFCADLGYSKHKNGGFRSEHKMEAVHLLRALTSIEMSVEKVLGGKMRRLRGPIWSRGLEDSEIPTEGSETDTIGDKGRKWEMMAFSFAPGPWFDDVEWRRYHRFMGRVGSGLLRLDNREEWAVLIGGYLATLMRTNAYKPLRLRISTILTRSGLARSEDAKRRNKANRDKFMAALDRLCQPEIAVIRDYRVLGTDVTEPDMDDPDDLAAYGAADVFPEDDWRSWVIEIVPMFEDEGKVLEGRRHKALTRAKDRARKRKSVDQNEEPIVSEPRRETNGQIKLF